MKALQLHYTSCRGGQSGSPGFQYHSHSKGLDPAELREIERIGAYTVSRDLDRDAEPDTVTTFPILYRYHRLESGRQAIVRSRYLGRDHTGRTGNYFAHTLVAEEGSFPRWPVDYYEWEGWKGALEGEDAPGVIPPPLPAVDLRAIAPASSFTLEELGNFLGQGPGRREHLARMLRALFAAGETSRSLVIRDGFFEGLFWVACLQKALPRAHAAAVTLSTYQYDNRDCELVSVSVGDTNFLFDENERRFQFFTFDFQSERFSEVPDGGGEYADRIAGWMAGSPARLGELHAFMERFHHDAIDERLIDALRLYLLGSEDRVTATPESVRGMVGFATEFTRPDSRQAVADLVVGTLDSLREVGEPEDYSLLIRFLVESAAATGDGHLVELAAEAWVDMFDALVPGERDTAELGSMRSLLAERLPTAEAVLAEAFLREPHLEQLVKRLPGLGQDALAAILDEARRSLDRLGRGDSWFRHPSGGFLGAVAGAAPSFEPLARPLLNSVAGNPELLGEAAHFLAEIICQETDQAAASDKLDRIGRLLVEPLSKLGQQDANRVRSRLDAPRDHNVLLGEFKLRLEHASDREEFFASWSKETAPAVPRFAARAKGRLREALARSLPDDRACALALDWLRQGELGELRKEFVPWCLERANRSLGLVKTDRVDLERLAEAGGEHGVTLLPDKPLLMSAMEPEKVSLAGLRRLARGDLASHVAALDSQDYQRFLNPIISPLLDGCRSRKEHGEVVRMLFNAAHQDEFTALYGSALTRLRSGEAFVAAVRFWLHLDPSPKHEGQLGRYRDQGLRVLRNVVSAMKGEHVKKIADRLEDDPEMNKKKQSEWKAITKRGWRLFGGKKSADD